MLFRIALSNIRRAGRDYLVYFLTLGLAVTVFYAFNTISFQVDIAGVGDKNPGMGTLLGTIISGLTIFLAFVMGFLLVYANNYIMRRRKREFGLYQILGMSRGQVSRIMTLETLFVSFAALVVGLAMGIALSQVMVFFTASIFKTQIANFHFFISPQALITTIGCMIAIFLVTLVFNLRVVRKAKVIDLMSASRRNENIKVRNAWVSAAIFVVGAIAIGIAYARLLDDGLPVDGTSEQMNAFLITTAIVVIGTILFFYGFSGFLLKALQTAKGLYWRGLNMVTLRQLSARVNTVSLSMAIISMILFLALTSVTTGMSLADVMNNSVERGTPVDYSRTLVYYSDEMVSEKNAQAAAAAETGTAGTDAAGTGAAESDAAVASAATPTYAVANKPVDIMEASKNDVVNPGTADERSFDLSEIAGEYMQVDAYSSTPHGASVPVVTLVDLCNLTGSELPAGMENSDVTSLGLLIMKESNYNEYLRFRGMDEIDLGENGYLILSDMGGDIQKIYNDTMRQHVELTIGRRTLTPISDSVPIDASSFINAMMGMNSGTVVLPDDLVDSLNLPLYNSYLMLNYADDISTEEGDEYVNELRNYGAGVQDDSGNIVGSWGTEASRTTTYESLDSMNGLISYLAIYIGFVLVLACAAILTIQQLSGVAEASPNYRILAELGTSNTQTHHSILVQQTIFFLFPLAIGAAHSAVALSVIVELVSLFGGLTIAGSAGMTVAIFLVAYGGYFLLTYAMSKGIVRDAVHLRHSL